MALTLPGCSERNEKSPADDSTEGTGPGVVHIVAEDYEGVLFTQNYSLGCYPDGDCPNMFDRVRTMGHPNSSFREGDAEEVEAAEVLLGREYQRAVAKGLLDGSTPPWKSVRSAVRQYAGFADSLGGQHLWINLLSGGAGHEPGDLTADDVAELSVPLDFSHGNTMVSYSVDGDSLHSWYAD